MEITVTWNHLQNVDHVFPNGEWLKMVLIDHLMDKMCTLACCWILHWTWWVLRNDCWIFCLDLHWLRAKAVLSTTLFATLGLANCLVRWKLKTQESMCQFSPLMVQILMTWTCARVNVSVDIFWSSLRDPKKLFKNRKGPGLSFCFCPCRRS